MNGVICFLWHCKTMDNISVKLYHVARLGPFQWIPSVEKIKKKTLHHCGGDLRPWGCFPSCSCEMVWLCKWSVGGRGVGCLGRHGVGDADGGFTCHFGELYLNEELMHRSLITGIWHDFRELCRNFNNVRVCFVRWEGTRSLGDSCAKEVSTNSLVMSWLTCIPQWLRSLLLPSSWTRLERGGLRASQGWPYCWDRLPNFSPLYLFVRS